LPDAICHKVPPNDVDAVFAALERLVRHPAEREAMGSAAQQIARRDHDPAVVAGHYVAFVRQVLDGIGRKFTR
jgi:glycosyltransferase involved in cell wall biosynthesis